MLDEEVDFNELKEKIELVEEKLDELSEQSEETEESVDFVQITSDKNDFFLHWIPISQTGFTSCDQVDSVQKAIQAFKQADQNRTSQQRSFLHGDMLVLMCNSAKEENEETSEVTYPDSCFYIGMCIATGNGEIHEEDPIPPINLSAKSSGKHFIAWYSCGGKTVDIEGHTGDVVESRLGAPSYEASCSNDTTLVTLTFPVFNKTLTFEDGLLKEVSEESQGESLSTILNLPCCCDDEECRENVTFILSNTDSTLQNFEGTDIVLPLSATLVNRNTVNDLPNEPPDCSSAYDGTPTGFVLEFTNRINNQAELRITTSLSGLIRSFYFIAPNDSDEPFRGVLNFDTSRNTGISTYTGTATIL